MEGRVSTHITGTPPWKVELVLTLQAHCHGRSSYCSHYTHTVMEGRVSTHITGTLPWKVELVLTLQARYQGRSSDTETTNTGTLSWKVE